MTILLLGFVLVLSLSTTNAAAESNECIQGEELATQAYLQSFDDFELTYFDGRGLAEVPRTLFATAGQIYKDYRLSGEDFNALKNTGDFKTNLNRVPILNHNGAVIGQSSAISRYLAQQFGMYGRNTKEAAQIDSLCEHIIDIKAAFRKLFPYKVEQTTEEKAINHDIWFNTEPLPELEGRKNRQLQWFLETMEGILGSDGFSVGGRPSLADAYLFNLLGEEATELGDKGEGWFSNRQGTDRVLALYPKLDAVVETFKFSPGMQTYLTTRGDMKF